MDMKNTIRTQKYVLDFHCIGGECENTCCQGWNITVDKKHFQWLKKTSTAFRDRKLFKQHVKRVGPPYESDTGYAVLGLGCDGFCPYLNKDKLCSLQMRFGHERLSDTCKEYPRQTRLVNDQPELTVSLSCPEAARACLFDPDAANVMEIDAKAASNHAVPPARYDLRKINLYPAWYPDLRSTFIALSREQGLSLQQRLYMEVVLADEIDAELRGVFNTEQADIPVLLEASRSADWRRRVLSEFAAGRATGDAAIDLIQAILALRLDARDDFGVLVSSCWDSCHFDCEQRVGEVGFEQRVLAQIRGIYNERRLGLEKGYGARMESYLSNYLSYFWFFKDCTKSPSLLKHIRRLLINLDMIRFLTYTHPSLADRDKVDEAVLKETLVDVVHRTARAFEYINPEFNQIVDQVFDEYGINGRAELLPFVVM